MLAFYMAQIDEEVDKLQFAEIYRAYRNQMYSLALSIVKMPDDAEDAVHDVFCRVATRLMPILRKITNKDDMRNYLLKATKNTCLNMLNKRDREKRYLTEGMTQDPDYLLRLSDGEFLELIYARCLAEQVVETLKMLPETYRDVLYYRYCLELSVSEIAALTDQKVGTVKKQVARGRALLLQKLELKGDELCVHD